MTVPLKALIVEDSEDDTLLLVHHLREGGFEASFRRVETGPAMRSALEAADWDVILSDHSMPQFSATDALKICREGGIEIPFIVVSGRIGEEAAVELMKFGAHDYIRKDDLGRLLPALSRELQSARDRRTRRRAEEAVVHLASIVESCEDAIISQTLDGIVLSWNTAAERIFGYAAPEMLGRSAAILLPPGAIDAVGDVGCSGRPARFETIRVRKDGRGIEVSLSLSPIKDVSGAVRSVATVARDIRMRKQEEADRVRLIQELSEALSSVRTLTGLLPICSACKRIRDDQGYWEQVEVYVQNHSHAAFTHGICPDCRSRLYPGLKPGSRVPA